MSQEKKLYVIYERDRMLKHLHIPTDEIRKLDVEIYHATSNVSTHINKYNEIFHKGIYRMSELHLHNDNTNSCIQNLLAESDSYIFRGSYFEALYKAKDLSYIYKLSPLVKDAIHRYRI